MFVAAEAAIVVGLAVAGGAYAYSVYVASTTPAAAAVVAAETGGAAVATSAASESVSIVVENGIVTVDTGIQSASYAAEQLLQDPTKWQALRDILYPIWEAARAGGVSPDPTLASQLFQTLRMLGMISAEYAPAAEPFMPLVLGG